MNNGDRKQIIKENVEYLRTQEMRENQLAFELKWREPEMEGFFLIDNN